jgi:coniferyl-aldehyde dehydrogenase
MISKTALVTGTSSRTGRSHGEAARDAGLGDILALQRTAFLRDGVPSLAQRRAYLNALKSVMLAQRNAIEDAINTDFAHHSRHETAALEAELARTTIQKLLRSVQARARA